MSDIQAFKREGLTVTRISQVTGISRPTVRKYLENKGAPRYSARPKRPGILTPYEPYLKERMAAGVWNGVVLLREIKERGYAGKYTALREYLQPLRKEAQTVAVRRFETPRGKQAQVDWGHLGDVTDEIGASLPLNGFVMTLGNSRAMFADAANDQKLPTFLAMHEAAFAHLGGVPETILYDNCKTVVLGYDDRGEPRFHPTFLDFARYWGFTPKLCRPYRPQTKGKVENGVGYVRKNFLCATDAKNLAELRVKLGIWCAEVANVRIHGTTHQHVGAAWEAEKPALAPVAGRAPYPIVPEYARTVARDAYVAFEANRYSVPWAFAGREVIVRDLGAEIEIHRDGARLAVHARCSDRHRVITVAAHHADMPFSGPSRAKIQLHLKAVAPEVAVRSLAEYAQAAEGAAA